MVDITELNRVNRLYAEMRAIDAMFNIFDHNGHITGIMAQMGDDVPAEQRESGTVPTGYMPQASSAQMINSIRDLMNQRHDQITGELQSLGFTGVDQPGPRMAAAKRKK
jgi:hypothetical protein